jgi:anti-sigma regulatory factor (Ser/Thr protein kinase)
VKLRRDPTSAALARRFVGRALVDGRCDDQEDIVVLLANELVTNAILHTGSDFDVVVDIEPQRVRVEVRDGSTHRPTRHDRGPRSTSGRGLALVEALASSWGVERIPGDGKSVWFEVGDAGR